MGAGVGITRWFVRTPLLVALLAVACKRSPSLPSLPRAPQALRAPPLLVRQRLRLPSLPWRRRVAQSGR